MTQKLLVEQQQSVASLILNRPDVHNAFDDELIRLLSDTLKQIGQDNSIRALILKSRGKNFSAGADLNWMQRMAQYTHAENYQDSLRLAELMRRLYQLNKPTLALVQGAAFGGAVGLIACCDIAIAGEQASFCLSEVKLGLIPAVISPYVIAAMGSRQAKRYFLTAEKFSAPQALQLGLLHEIVAEEQLETRAEQILKQLLQNSPNAVREAKKLVHYVEEHPYDASMIEKTAQWIADLRASAEGQEGLQAFLQKRKARWVDNV